MKKKSKSTPAILWTFPAPAPCCFARNAPASINFERRQFLSSYDGGPGVCSAKCAPIAAARAAQPRAAEPPHVVEQRAAEQRRDARHVARSLGEGEKAPP